MNAVRTHDLTIGYAPARSAPHVVASALNLDLKAGELVCLLGPNGAGKSTLMRTLSGMQPSLGGHVTIGDGPLDALTASERARRIGIVLTERIDVGYLSGYALVSLGRYPYTDWSGRMTAEDHRVVSDSIEAVGATDLAHRPVSELSDGERQKMMIARVLAQKTDIILLDEPTAFLDLARRVEIVALLRTLAHEAGKAILMSTHDLEIAVRNADRIWLMTGGDVQSGIPESLVLNRSFEKAFARDGIEFDRSAGAFRPTHQPAAAIAFPASGLTAAWTTRALERIGFDVRSEREDDVPLLELAEEDEKTVWTLTDEEVRHFDRLDDLIEHLRGQVIGRTVPDA